VKKDGFCTRGKESRGLHGPENSSKTGDGSKENGKEGGNKRGERKGARERKRRRERSERRFVFT